MPRIRKGAQLGPYNLVNPLQELYRDRAIEAWLAQLTDGPQVVLKIIRVPHEGLDEEDQRAYAIFRNEVELLQKLRHLNVVRIYPLHPQALSIEEERYLSGLVFRDETWWFWAMEHLQGGSLASRGQQVGRLPLQEVAEIAYQVGAALDYIHSKALVHLNFHPQTIFFRYPLLPPDPRVEVVLTDFSAATRADGPLTEPGFKPYMAPEGIKWARAPSDQPPDLRPADVYALGALLYEMLAGTPPFTGRDEDLERAILEIAPPPLQRFDIPPEIEDLIFRALRKDPAERPSVEEMMTSLDKSVPSPRRFGRRMAAPVAERRAPRPLAVRAPEILRQRRPSFFRVPVLTLRRLVSYPVPRLLQPEEGAFVKGEVTFAWEWQRRLKDNEAFQLRIWKEDEDQHIGAGDLRKEPEVEIDLDPLLSERAEEGDKCFWTVVVVQENTYWELSKEAQPRSFTYGGPPAEEEVEAEKRADVEVGEGN